MKGRLNAESWVLTTPVAHRGLHGESCGENSLSAYKSAVEHGYPIEMDVQLTKDGVLVCFHDDSLKRVTGVDGYINDFTYEELKHLKILNTQDYIPTFEEFLKLVNGQVPVMIEIKRQRSKNYDIAKMTTDALKDYQGEFVVQSFDPFIMLKVKKYAPDYLRGQLGGVAKKGELPFIQYVVVKYMPFNFLLKPDYINYLIDLMPINKKIPTVCWTVRTQENLLKAKELKVNYVFENVNPKCC